MSFFEKMDHFTNKIILLFLIFLGFVGTAAAQKKEKIEIRRSNSAEVNSSIAGGARRFLGDVVFEHNKATMYCDSAYFFGGKNIMHAYGHVHISRGDTLHMYGDYLEYSGDTDIGKVRRNVRLVDEEATLYTDSLDFNTATNIAYYFNGGKIINNQNQLVSETGFYYANDDVVVYNDSVVVTNPDYIIYTDTLKYNTKLETAFFVGPTNIFNDESHLYAENGWYNTKEKKFQFNENAVYQNKEKILKGDSLYYDELNGIGIAIKNIEMIDTAENMILKGNYAYYVKEPEHFLITDSALLIQVADYTDSLFLHADTIRSDYDSSATYRILKAFHKVQIFRDDLQARCDSMVYNFKDSVISMYRQPVIWSQGSQITANLVEVHIKNEKIDFFKLIAESFIVSQEDTARYNQIRGKEMYGYVRNNKLHRVDVFGNGQTIYYTKDGEDILGVNFAESSDLIIYMKNNNPSRINLLKQPTGTLYPPDELEEDKLKGFNWLEYLRPKSKMDIFYWK